MRLPREVEANRRRRRRRRRREARRLWRQPTRLTKRLARAARRAPMQVLPHGRQLQLQEHVFGRLRLFALPPKSRRRRLGRRPRKPAAAGTDQGARHVEERGRRPRLRRVKGRALANVERRHVGARAGRRHGRRDRLLNCLKRLAALRLRGRHAAHPKRPSRPRPRVEPRQPGANVKHAHLRAAAIRARRPRLQRGHARVRAGRAGQRRRLHGRPRGQHPRLGLQCGDVFVRGGWKARGPRARGDGAALLGDKLPRLGVNGQDAANLELRRPGA
mmetsp:Transcript_17137/g.57896  ORF Transcript_17137/g.57896 Transcript_17137/m.57896 type:complete len:274 (-) Transcript_17137:498-1319(-)